MASAAVFALFARAAVFSYIGLDDAAYTFRNPFVAGGLSSANLREAFTNLCHGGIWMPVTYFSYMVDASLCKAIGMPVIGWMHVINILLHVVNFLLLCRFAAMIQGEGDRYVAVLVASLFWALHPLRAEPVAWIAARKELLWSIFTMIGLLLWCRRSWTPAYVCCALACLSKPTAMCFPLLAGLVEWQTRRGTSESPMHARWRTALRYLPMFAMAATTAAIAAYSQTHVAGQGATSLYEVPFANRLVNAFSAAGFYLRATLLPFGLHFDCRTVTGVCPISGAWNIGVFALFAVGAIFLFSPMGKGVIVRRQFVLAVGWFVLALLPTLGVFGGFGIEAHADRFAYVPSMALSIVLVPFLSRPVVQRFAVAGLVMLSALAFRQLGFWRDGESAYARTLACDPCHPRAMLHLGDVRCSRHGDFDGGIRFYRQAIAGAATVPRGGFDAEDAKARLAYALATRGRDVDFLEVKELGAAVLRDVRLDRRGMMLDALGTAFMHDGDMKRAASLFAASIRAPDRFWPKASTIRKLERCKLENESH